MKISTNRLNGFYGAYRQQPKHIYLAIACGRMLQYRGQKKLRGFEQLLAKTKDWPDEGYPRRSNLLKHFRIETYRDYLRSELWTAVRSLAINRDDRRCSFCRGRASQVHHRSYDISTLSGAKIDRLYSTCDDCHRGLEFDEDGYKLSFEVVRLRTINLAGRKKNLNCGRSPLSLTCPPNL